MRVRFILFHDSSALAFFMWSTVLNRTCRGLLKTNLLACRPVVRTTGPEDRGTRDPRGRIDTDRERIDHGSRVSGHRHFRLSWLHLDLFLGLLCGV